jgi:hypothetical protein
MLSGLPPPFAADAFPYMVVDRRHDHSFRIPRPDLSTSLDTPNACNNCHAEKSAQWAASAIESWHGEERKGFQKYARAFHAAWTDQTNAQALLSAVAADRNTPAFARAGALTELASRASAGAPFGRARQRGDRRAERQPGAPSRRSRHACGAHQLQPRW